MTGAAQGHDALGRLIPGHSEYAAKKRRIAHRLEQLMADYNPTPSTVMLLGIIARALDDAERARTSERRTRAANTANRLLRSIPRKSAPKPPSLKALGL
jgi:glutamate-1-semialdehyde aminotransferase